VETLLQDLRYSCRLMLKKPGFTLVVVIALSLGIGANTAIFSVVNAVLLRPLPYRKPDRLVRVWEKDERSSQPGSDQSSVSPANFIDWRNQSQTLAEMAAFGVGSVALAGRDEPEQVSASNASATLFPLLGVEPMLGRIFIPEEEQPGHNTVVLIGHSLWQRRFGSDANLVGQTLMLDNRTFTVVGIMPPGFEFPKDTELWTPLAFNAGQEATRGAHFLEVIARIKPSVMLPQVRAEMDTIARQLQLQYPATNTGFGVTVIKLLDQEVGNIRPALFVLLGAVGFVLLIACANVANLLLARATTRQHEIAVRLALGANRLRIIRQLLTESVLLAVLGGSLGLLLSMWGTSALLKLGPSNIPRLNEVRLDARMLAFTLAISVLTGVIFGLVPAFQSSKPDVNEALKEGGRKSTGGIKQNRMRRLLIVSEIALAMVVLVGAGLMIKGFLRLLEVDSGLNPKNVLAMKVKLHSGYDPQRTRAFYRQLIERIEAIPGVEVAGATTMLPLAGDNRIYGFRKEGESPETLAEKANFRAVTTNYFHAIGISLVRGREFTETDTDGKPLALMINESMARRFWPDEDPLGKRVTIRNGPLPHEIVGVVKDVKHFGLDKTTEPEMYVPHAQFPAGAMAVVVHTTTDPLRLVSAIQNQVPALDKNQPITSIKTMEQIIADSLSPQRFTMLLLSFFAGIALILVVVGIYGVMACTVSQRTREIGIRMSLGAQASDVFRMIMRQALVLTLIGIGLGLAAALAVTRVMSSLLYGVNANDATTFIGISLILVMVALAASYLPARNGAKVDPMVAMRHE